MSKRLTIEELVVDETINRETYQRKHKEVSGKIAELDTTLARLDSNHAFDFNLLEEVLTLTRNIPKAYEEAPHFLKKKYLAFFFDRIIIDDKNIENTLYSPLIKELIEQQEVIIRTKLLPALDEIRNSVSGEIYGFQQ